MTTKQLQALENAGTVIIKVETDSAVDALWAQGCTQLNEFGKQRQDELRQQSENDREVAKRLLLK
jgi:hypothetical protein